MFSFKNITKMCYYHTNRMNSSEQLAAIVAFERGYMLLYNICFEILGFSICVFCFIILREFYGNVIFEMKNL